MTDFLADEIVIDLDPPMVDVALDLASRGWSVFPLHEPTADGGCTCRKPDCGSSRGKHPRSKHWPKQATTDPPRIRALWRQYPNANVGVATGKASGIVVVDVDPAKGGSARDLPPSACVVETGSGGLHVFYRYPAGTVVPNAVGVRPGIDIRSDGGLVVGAGSLHFCGERYGWLDGLDGEPANGAPAWALGNPAKARAQSDSRAPAWTEKAAAPIADGARNATLTEIVGGLVRDGLRGAGLLATAHAVNDARCVPPLPHGEVQTICESIEGRDGSRCAGKVRTMTALAVKPETVAWLWRGRIPLGKLTVLDGDPGLGKSWITIDLAARMTAGEKMPDGSASELDGPAAVMIVNLEDGAADTVVPRFIAAGGDRSRLFLLDSEPDERGEYEHVDLGDVARIEATVREHGIRLLIVDPLMAALPEGVNAHHDQDIRRVLAPLSAMADRTGCAVLVVRHLNKKSGGNAINRGGGSIGIGGAARSVLLAAKDPDDAEHSRVLAVVKTNLAMHPASLRYRVDGEPPRIAWGEEISITADELLAEPDRRQMSGSDRELAALRTALTFAPRRSDEIYADVAAAVAADANDRAFRDRVQRRARKLGVIIKRDASGHTTWASGPTD